MADPNDDTGGAGGNDAAATAAAAAEKAKFDDAVKVAVGAALPDAVKAAMPRAPEKYELAAPQGVTVDQAVVDAVAKRAKDLGLSQDNAQKLLVSTLEERGQFQTSLTARHAKTVEGWLNQVKADEVLGGKDGSKLDATIAVTDKVLEKFGSPELKTMLSKSGYGSHPDWVRFVYKIGLAMKNDTVLGDGANVNGDGKKPRTPEERAQRMFPSTAKNQGAAA